MLLKSPFLISSRLLPAVKVGEATISLERTGRYDDRNAMVWRWYIDTDSGEFTDDEFSGHDGLQGKFGSLLCFIDAFAESWRYGGAEGENSSLFPPELSEWAMQNQDEVGSLRIELEETPDLTEE